MGQDVWIKKIGTKRGAPYVFFDGLQAIRAGFSPGQKFDIQVDTDKITLSINQDGSRTVSSRKKIDHVNGEVLHPVIDINSKELLKLFDGMEAIRVVVQPDKVYLLPLASEIKKKERLDRINQNLAQQNPLKMGSISHGGGILSHAIHTGLTKAGFEVELNFANEIREDLIQQAIQHNDAWHKNTSALAMPMQELAQDEWLLSRLPKLDILELGLPCSGASLAGKSKKGLSQMEDHESVGHLVFSALSSCAKNLVIHDGDG